MSTGHASPQTHPPPIHLGRRPRRAPKSAQSSAPPVDTSTAAVRLYVGLVSLHPVFFWGLTCRTCHRRETSGCRSNALTTYDRNDPRGVQAALG